MAGQEGSSAASRSGAQGLYDGLDAPDYVDAIEVEEGEAAATGGSHPATLALAQRSAQGEAASAERSDEQLLAEMREAHSGRVNTRIADRESDVSVNVRTCTGSVCVTRQLAPHHAPSLHHTPHGLSPTTVPQTALQAC